MREDDNPEVDGDQQGEDHVGESHPKAALWLDNKLGQTLRGTLEYLENCEHPVGNADGNEESGEEKVDQQEHWDPLQKWNIPKVVKTWPSKGKPPHIFSIFVILGHICWKHVSYGMNR